MIHAIAIGTELEALPVWTTTAVVILGTDGKEAPWAPGGLPLLGHALAYRTDPSGFMVRTTLACGPVFRLNLAGRHMVLVCGPEEQRQLATLPDSVLSSRKAVADIGFEHTLGTKNVYDGTQIHKGIVKAIWSSTGASDSASASASGGTGGAESPADRQLIAWKRAIRDALEIEVGACKGNKTDFLHLVRKVILRSSVEMYVGTAFLKGWTAYDFLEEEMSFQDMLEDVTAKAAVFPRWLALVTMLWPFQRRREAMQRVIEERLEVILKEDSARGRAATSKEAEDDEETIGFWLRELLAQKIPVPDIAEYVVGLLFAAHKNPAIGAAQTYLLLREHGSKDVMARCQTEAEALVASSSTTTTTTTPRVTWARFGSALPTLRRACLESLRLTAHSIGAVRKVQRDVTVRLGNADADVNDSGVCYRIPKGATVGFAHITSSLDPTIWGKNAASFDAGLDQCPDDRYEDDYKFTTFSNGTHKCPGRVLAMIKLHVTVALLLTEYDVELPDNLPALDFERATLAQRHGPVFNFPRRIC
eukprot:jgi/Psemu1/297512/fgenesh1_pm.305_\